MSDPAIEPVGNPFEWAAQGLATGGLSVPAKLAGNWITRNAFQGAAGGLMGGAAADVADRRNPLPNAPANVIGGAALGPVLPAIGRAVGRMRPRPAPVAAPKPAPSMPQSDATLTPPKPEPSNLPPHMRPKAPVTPGGFQPTAQQQTAGASSFYDEVLADPGIQARMKELGAGKVQTNAESIAEAAKRGPMHPDEIANWKAETPLNTVEQTRALLTKDAMQRKMLQAFESNDMAGMGEAAKVLRHIEPGVQALRGTGGRLAQAQAMFVQDRVSRMVAEIADMREKGLPYEQIAKRVAEMRKDMARDEAVGKAFGKVKDWVNALETYATAAKLTSPVTHAVNSVSNALTFMVSRPLEKVGASAAMLAQRNPKGAAANLHAMFGTTSGFKSGARKYLSTLMEDAPDLGKLREGAPGAVPKFGKVGKALRPLNPFRQLGGADAFWRTVIEDSELHSRAMASAMEQGLKGKALAQRTTELINNPPASWRTDAEAVAREFTFQDDPDAFLQKVSKLQGIPGMRFVLPFVRTPYNIAKFQAQRSPLGVLSGRNLRGLASGGKPQAEAAGRLMAGAALASTALAVVHAGDVTGEYPSDPGERGLWEAEGRRAYSIRLGDRWLQYNRFAPLGLYLSQAAALREASQAGNEGGATAAGAKLMGQSAKAILDMPFVQGMSSLLDAIQDPKRSAERFIGSTASGLLPNIIRDVRQQTDPVRREARGIVPVVQNMIPGASQALPPQVDILGREQGYDPNPGVRATKVLSQTTATPETAALRRSGYSPSEPRPEIRSKGRTDKLKGDDGTRFQQDMGAATVQAIRSVSGRAGFEQMDPEEQAEAIKQAVDKARNAVRKRWRTQRSVNP